MRRGGARCVIVPSSGTGSWPASSPWRCCPSICWCAACPRAPTACFSRHKCCRWGGWRSRPAPVACVSPRRSASPVSPVSPPFRPWPAGRGAPPRSSGSASCRSRRPSRSTRRSRSPPGSPHVLRCRCSRPRRRPRPSVSRNGSSPSSPSPMRRCSPSVSPECSWRCGCRRGGMRRNSTPCRRRSAI